MNQKKIFILKDVLDILTDSELKNVVGGYSSGNGTCCWHSTSSCECGVSRFIAIGMAGCQDRENGTNCNGGGWCCDNCATSTWARGCGY